MAVGRKPISARSALSYKVANKDRRKQFHIQQKKAKDSLQRELRNARKKEENKNPKLKEERRVRNKPKTIDTKRTWDDALGEDGEDMLGLSVNLEKLNKRRRVEEEEKQELGEAKSSDEEAGSEAGEEETDQEGAEHDSDLDSWLEDNEDDETKGAFKKPALPERAASPKPSTSSTKMDLTPESLAAKFHTLFEPPAKEPKVLITTSLNSTLHDQAQLLTALFPNSQYVRRSAHRFGHKFSVTEIASFAANRNFTTLLILMEDKKKPAGLDVVHLPDGPMFHFSMTNWIEGKKLPGHGNPTNHYPELILNNFRTPLGLLIAHLFHTIFPPVPELEGRQVVTLHNQRDYIFFRRHRYIFRNKRATEKSILDTDGKPIKGVEDIKAGLQELGPRFTLKLRRVDKGIQRRSGQEWEWKGRTDKVRTKFQL
ncbi:Brix-domain-containing protein [Tothia fuscella]|uniref:Brix-domain-containing protein n=1 Tax=Tothia fuscella TaxID=1048955 RepID=A0A9P4TVF0_9PEZI|nr:Brix-domain-containing protein [Tothia fuscella]